MTMVMEQWLSPAQAGRLLRLSRQQVLHLAGQGRLRFVMTANGRLIDPQSVEEEIERRQQKAGQQ